MPYKYPARFVRFFFSFFFLNIYIFCFQRVITFVVYSVITESAAPRDRNRDKRNRDVTSAAYSFFICFITHIVLREHTVLFQPALTRGSGIKFLNSVPENLLTSVRAAIVFRRHFLRFCVPLSAFYYPRFTREKKQSCERHTRAPRTTPGS